MKLAAKIGIALSVLLILALSAILATQLVHFSRTAADRQPFSGGDGILYSDAETYRAGDTEIPAADLSDIDIHWIAGKVQLEIYDGTSVVLSETGAEKEEDRLRWRVKDGELTVQWRKSERFSVVDTLTKDLTVRIPRTMVLRELDIESVSAGIFIPEISVSDELSLETVSGNIQIGSLSAEKLDVSTVSGNTKFSGAVPEISWESVSGSLTMTDTVYPREIKGESVSGDLYLKLPDAGFTLKASTGGEVSCDVGTVKNGKSQVYGDGRTQISFHSVSGRLTLLTR